MKTKVCNTCGLELPDTREYFNMRLKKGGVWGTVVKCRSCMTVRRKEMRDYKKFIMSQVGARQTNTEVH
jgi:RNase P subunit RPR2